MQIKKIDDVRFEIEKDPVAGMNTNVRLYATEAMLEKIRKDRTIPQAINAATLPGLVGNVLLMPDAHEGYGVPIGNVMAFKEEDGLVSPGAVGYDINCLHPETKIYDENGSWLKISELKYEERKVRSFDKKPGCIINTTPLLLLEKMGHHKILRIKTSFGKEILVTGDHPILSRCGMVPARNLVIGDSVVTSGFEGIEYEKPVKKLILSRWMLFQALNLLLLGRDKKNSGKTQALNFLNSHGLDEITSENKKLETIIKLLGFVFGDGTIPEMRRGSRRTVFYGKEADMLEIKEDIESLGFSCFMRRRCRHHKITTIYKTYEFDYAEYSVTVSSTAFTAMLVALGAPIGNKVTKKYGIPDWILGGEDYQKRLFISAFFGAELSTPITPNDKMFVEPYFRVSKLEKLKSNALKFLFQIKTLLNSLGIETSDPLLAEDYRYLTKKGICISFRMRILAYAENLRKIFGNVGYIYNKEKERTASLVTVYLSYLNKIRVERANIKIEALQMHRNGARTCMVVQALSSEYAGKSYIEHTIWGRVGNAQTDGAIKFDEFVEMFELGKSGLVYDRIVEVKSIDYDGAVFDLSINDENHNFLANGIVVSNCGVRLIKTNLTEKEVRPKLNNLMDRLFVNVPSGVGSRLKIGLSSDDLHKVAEEGAGYIINKGFGFVEDIERIEENGSMKGADFSKVSDMAKSRGRDQLGTLGAGNHFLEVQKIERIFSESIAKHYGLFEGQVVVMVHTGSRGFGHQICSDYLRTLVEYQHRNNIKFPDLELSYAMIGDKEADDYLGAMKCAVNYAFTNRQLITNSIRKSFEEVFTKSADALGMEILYDVAHNIAKLEEHIFEHKKVNVYVHRKGATRAFSKGRQEVPKIYRDVGQPVIIPGSMGTASYVLCGKEGAMEETFGSTCHGSGRLMSRHQAIREISASKTFDDLESKGIVIRVRTRKLISEEAEWAYKNVDDVVGVVAKAGLSDIVARNLPMGVAKG